MTWHQRAQRRFKTCVILGGDGPFAVTFSCFKVTGEVPLFLFATRWEAEKYLTIENERGCKYCGIARPGRQFGYHTIVDLRTAKECAAAV